MGYQVKWSQSENSQTTYYKLNTEDTIGETQTPNTIWSTEGCYAGTNVSIIRETGGIVFGNDYLSCNYTGSTLGSLNLRFCVSWGTATNKVSRFGYRWTGLETSGQNYYNTRENTNVSIYNPAKNDMQSVPTVGAAIHASHWFISPLKNLSINDLIFYPQFTISTITYTGYRGYEPESSTDGRYYTTANVSNTTRSWADIKPEDNTPAGQYYDEDLWTKGYKILDNDVEHYQVQYVAGVNLTPYYGKSSKVYDKTNDSYSNITPTPAIVYGLRSIFGSLTSDTDEFPSILEITNRNRPTLMVCIEGYEADTGSVIYTSLNGISFSSVLQGYTSTDGTTGTVNPLANGTALNNTNFNTVNLYYNNTTYGGIITEQTYISDPSECKIIIPSIRSLQGTLDFADTTTWGVGTNNSYRYLPNFDSGCVGSIAWRRSLQGDAQNAFYSISELWQAIASIGCYVAARQSDAQNAQLGQNVGDNDNIYLGEMLANGTTTGNMLQGGEIADSTQAGIDDIIQGTPYTPVTPGPGGGDDPSNPPTPSGKNEGKITGDGTTGHKTREFGSGSITYYALSISDAATFKNLLWAQPKNFYEAIQISGKQNASIFDYISSYRYYPTDITSLGISLGASSDIHLGTGAIFKQTDGTDYKLQPLSNFYTQFSWCSWSLSAFNGWRNNFLDYSPYCKLSIYLPYAGTFDLDVQTVAAMVDITTATINVTVCIDINTGSLTYYVDANGFLILDKTLKLGIDLPLSGNDAIQQSVAILQSNYHNGSQAIGMATNLATSGDALSALTAVAQLPFNVGEMALASSLANRQIPTQVGGFGGTLSTVTMGQDPYITIYRQKVANPDNYGHVVGYLTESKHTIGELIGWTICTNVDLTGIPATSSERSMIAQILQSGFYA